MKHRVPDLRFHLRHLLPALIHFLCPGLSAAVADTQQHSATLLDTCLRDHDVSPCAILHTTSRRFMLSHLTHTTRPPHFDRLLEFTRHFNAPVITRRPRRPVSLFSPGVRQEDGRSVKRYQPHDMITVFWVVIRYIMTLEFVSRVFCWMTEASTSSWIHLKIMYRYFDSRSIYWQ